LFTAWLAAAMLLIIASDARRFVIPDVLSLPTIPLGMAANSVVLHVEWYAGMLESLMGIALGGGTLYLLRWAYFRLRGIEGLGLGDVKLGAVAGAWLGPDLLAPACLVASMAALVGAWLIRDSHTTKQFYKELHIPLGCFIAPVILLFWLYRLWEAGLPVS
jgi:leader peptidase (prepilin peptidase)/N-methyltransferase